MDIKYLKKVSQLFYKINFPVQNYKKENTENFNNFCKILSILDDNQKKMLLNLRQTQRQLSGNPQWIQSQQESLSSQFPYKNSFIAA